MSCRGAFSAAQNGRSAFGTVVVVAALDLGQDSIVLAPASPSRLTAVVLAGQPCLPLRAMLGIRAGRDEGTVVPVEQSDKTLVFHP